jgi:hypothetical protein
MEDEKMRTTTRFAIPRWTRLLFALAAMGLATAACGGGEGGTGGGGGSEQSCCSCKCAESAGGSTCTVESTIQRSGTIDCAAECEQECADQDCPTVTSATSC